MDRSARGFKAAVLHGRGGGRDFPSREARFQSFECHRSPVRGSSGRDVGRIT
jgi:hypothetical protein